MSSPLFIDGAMGEGGGQVLRTALSLSALQGRAVEIGSIRSNRSKPGLAAQHLACVEALADLCAARVEGAALGSTSLVFTPARPPRGGEHRFAIDTAGSTTLLAQALLPALLRADAPSRVVLVGGTHVPLAPTFDYFEGVFLPALRRIGLGAAARLARAGYYPAGGGEIELSVTPAPVWSGFDWTADTRAPDAHAAAPVLDEEGAGGAPSAPPPTPALARIVASGVPADVAEREVRTLRESLAGGAAAPPPSGAASASPPGLAGVEVLNPPSASPGNAVLLRSRGRGGQGIGARGKLAESVAREALAAYRLSEGFSVDEHLADQLMLYAALAEGPCRYTAPAWTLHAQTNAQLIGEMTGKLIRWDGAVHTVEVEEDDLSL